MGISVIVRVAVNVNDKMDTTANNKNPMIDLIAKLDDLVVDVRLVRMQRIGDVVVNPHHIDRGKVLTWDGSIC